MTPSQPLRNDSHHTVGVLAVELLQQNGVDTVFGIPGTHNREIYRGIESVGLRHILTRHEQGACYAADGYARSTGRPGVVIATSGPGVTNCLTGIANAYADSVPILVVSPGPARGYERRDMGQLHEAKDQRLGLDSFADRSVRTETVTALIEAIHETFFLWHTTRPRPVHIEIPVDLLDVQTDARAPKGLSVVTPRATGAALDRAVEILLAANRPLILVGGGAAGACTEVEDLVEITGAPILTTQAGKGVLSETNSKSLGAIAGTSQMFPGLEHTDCIAVFGSEFKNTSHLAVSAHILRFDIDPRQLHKHHPADAPVLGDVRTNLGSFNHRLREHAKPFADSDDWPRWLRKAAQERRAAAERQWGIINQAIVTGSGGDPIMAGDSSRVSYIGTQLCFTARHPRRFITTDGYATLGYGLPAAIGARIGNPDQPVVALIGDGAFMFSMQELSVAVVEKLPIPIVIFDDGGFSEIRSNMQDVAIEPIAVDLISPDYQHLAKAFGCGCEEADTPDALSHAVSVALEKNYPTLIIVRAKEFSHSTWRSTVKTSKSEIPPRGHDVGTD